jgi:hypothetical protein
MVYTMHNRYAMTFKKLVSPIIIWNDYTVICGQNLYVNLLGGIVRHVTKIVKNVIKTETATQWKNVCV